MAFGLFRHGAAWAALAVLAASGAAVLTAALLTPDSGALRAASAATLLTRLDAAGLETAALAGNRAKVPRRFVTHLPGDWRDMADAGQRKRGFVALMLPLVLAANERILADRARLERLLELRASGQSLWVGDRAWLRGLSRAYRAGPDRPGEFLRRVDAVPPSLVIAQSAIESGWGSSRFAGEGNALFGQWTWGRGAGIVPLGRDQGKTHKIRKFGQLADSVAAYMRNLNVHAAYARFRDLRARGRAAGVQTGGSALAGALERYSERGPAYVADLRGIIAANGLAALDGARLAPRSY